MENIQPSAFQKNDSRVTTGWAFFDWANSAYALVITAAIFPGYFTKNTDPVVHIGSFALPNTTLYAYSVSFAYLLIAIASPALSGIADYGGKKKFFLRLFTTFGAISCCGLFFFEGMPTLWLGMACFVVSFMGFAGGLVFYNSYLPIIATEEKFDTVSAKGFAFGYVGSVILLIVNLATILKPEWFGLADSKIAARLSFVMVGLWWFGFAQIPLKRLPDDNPRPVQAYMIGKGFEELKKVWNIFKTQANIKGFLLAFFFYNAGVQAVIYLASTFAEKELHFEASELIILILILQIVAIAGAYLFALISGWMGNKFSLALMLLLWVGICITGFYLQGKPAFYVLGGCVGAVMGGVQSLSRSTFSKLLPEGTIDTASFFSFMDVADKVSVVLGTFAFGLVEELTGNIRYSLLFLAVFFIAGFIALMAVRIGHVGNNRMSK